MIAANFRTEATSTTMWLLDHNIKIISFSAGNEANINLINLVIKQATLTGFNLWEYSNEAVSETLEQLFKLAKQDDIRPTIDSTFSLEEFEAAFERLTSRKVVGRAVFKI